MGRFSNELKELAPGLTPLINKWQTRKSKRAFPASLKQDTNSMGTRKTKIHYLQDELRRKRFSCATAISELEGEISDLYMNTLGINTKNKESLQEGHKKAKNYIDELQRRHEGNTRKSQEVEHRAEINLLRNKLKNQGKGDADIKKEVNKFKNELQAATRKAIPGKFTRRLEQHVLSKLPQITSNSSKLYKDGKPIGDEIQRVLGSAPLDMKNLEDIKSKVDNLVKILSTKPGVFAKALSSRERSELQGVVDAYSIKVRELKIPSNLEKQSPSLGNLKQLQMDIDLVEPKVNDKDTIKFHREKLVGILEYYLEEVTNEYYTSKSDENGKKLINAIRFYKKLSKNPKYHIKKEKYTQLVNEIKDDPRLNDFVEKYRKYLEEYNTKDENE
jgi:hypothetical protein